MNGDAKNPKNTGFDTDCAMRSASTDRTQRCIQYANTAGLEDITLVKKYVAERSSSKIN